MAPSDKDDNDRLRDVEISQAEANILIQQMHTALMGNGRPGMLAEFQQVKGAMKFVKIISTSGLVAGLIAIVNAFK